MPRGLGDNPLKKERKTRRSTAQAVPISATPVSPSDFADSTVGQDGAQASSSSSRSYNDVFFQRRPDNSGAAANGIHEEPRSEDSGTTAPIAAAQASPISALPEVTASAVTEPAPAEVAVAPPTSSSFAPPEPVPAPSAIPESVPEAKSVPDQPVAQPVQTPQPAPAVQTAPTEEKTGFFGRIFGKLRK